MKIYGSTISPFVRKAVVFAEEKRVKVELVPTAPGDTSPAFRAISPFGQIPALVDGDFTLADSSAIVAYLESKHPEPALIPADPQARGRTIWFDELADTVVFGAGRAMLFHRVVGPLFRGGAGDAAVADAAERDQWPAILAYVNGAITERDFLVGDRLTLADIAIASAFGSALHACAPVDQAAYPDLARYLDAMLARPAFATRLAGERAFIQRAREKISA